MIKAIHKQQQNLDKRITKLMKRFPVLSCIIMAFLTPLFMLFSVGVITAMVIVPLGLLFGWL